MTTLPTTSTKAIQSGFLSDRIRLLGRAAPKSTSSCELGMRGESHARQVYESQGFSCLAQNWRSADGEIDLIFQKGSTLVFVEVKTRAGGSHGDGFEAVDWRKQRQVRKLALRYLASTNAIYDDVRFDVASVTSKGQVKVKAYCF